MIRGGGLSVSLFCHVLLVGMCYVDVTPLDRLVYSVVPIEAGWLDLIYSVTLVSGVSC